MVTTTPNAVTERGRTMQNVVGYVRVSTQGQARDVYSLQNQVDEIIKYCEKTA
jgi:predicted site-specific integrase-resolvase